MNIRQQLLTFCWLLQVVIFLTFLPASAGSDNGGISIGPTRGLITSARCPYGCIQAHVPKEFCREYQLGDVCQVEDFRQAPGHRTMVLVPASPETSLLSTTARSSRRDIDGTWIDIERGSNAPLYQRGLITTASCPYSCSDAGLSLAQCRETRLGNICQVEDLTQPPGHRSMVYLP